MSTHLKTGIIILGALVITSVGISASDVMRNLDGSRMLGLVTESNTVCPEGTALVSFGTHAVCFDVYEASTATSCLYDFPINEVQTYENMKLPGCIPVSKANQQPWTYVSHTQAQQLCAKTGKRLPTNAEWYKAVSGLTDTSMCVTNTKNTQPNLTGTETCRAPSGTYDQVGNVWEWVEAEVIDGMYNNQALPKSGYVATVDGDGVALQTSVSPQLAYDEDYFYLQPTGTVTMMRGGFYSSGDDAGIYSINATTPANFKTAGIGFRCVQDIL